MFLPAKSGVGAIRPAVLICNPNGGLYEFHHLQMDWVKFYTDRDCHVLVYNYRGYGRCAGAPSPLANNLDGLAIVAYLKTERGVPKIAVHGESIGVRESVSACVWTACLSARLIDGCVCCGSSRAWWRRMSRATRWT